ncbi:MAG TPA: hypothetical protein PKV21_07705 [bacterium]|nr:hypothetical protein [bacterium]
MDLNKENWGWSIPDSLLERMDLDMYEKVLIAIMGRLGALERPIFPRQKWLAKKLGITERAVRNILERLKKKGIVKYEGKSWKIAKYSLTEASFNSSQEHRSSDSQEHRSGDSQEHRSGDNKDIQSKDIQSIDIIKEKENKEKENNFSDKDRKELIYLFKDVNPNYKILFSRKNQSDALERLIKTHGRKKIEFIIKILAKTNKMKYAPIITTPISLENKLGDLIAFLQKEKNKVDENKIIKI